MRADMEDERFDDGKPQYRENASDGWQDMPVEALWNRYQTALKLYRETLALAANLKDQRDEAIRQHDQVRRRLLSRTM